MRWPSASRRPIGVRCRHPDPVPSQLILEEGVVGWRDCQPWRAVRDELERLLARSSRGRSPRDGSFRTSSSNVGNDCTLSYNVCRGTWIASAIPTPMWPSNSMCRGSSAPLQVPRSNTRRPGRPTSTCPGSVWDGNGPSKGGVHLCGMGGAHGEGRASSPLSSRVRCRHPHSPAADPDRLARAGRRGDALHPRTAVPDECRPVSASSATQSACGRHRMPRVAAGSPCTHLQDYLTSTEDARRHLQENEIVLFEQLFQENIQGWNMRPPARAVGTGATTCRRCAPCGSGTPASGPRCCPTDRTSGPPRPRPMRGPATEPWKRDVLDWLRPLNEGVVYGVPHRPDRRNPDPGVGATGTQPTDDGSVQQPALTRCARTTNRPWAIPRTRAGSRPGGTAQLPVQGRSTPAPRTFPVQRRLRSARRTGGVPHCGGPQRECGRPR